MALNTADTVKVRAAGSPAFQRSLGMAVNRSATGIYTNHSLIFVMVFNTAVIAGVSKECTASERELFSESKRPETVKTAIRMKITAELIAAMLIFLDIRHPINPLQRIYKLKF